MDAWHRMHDAVRFWAECIPPVSPGSLYGARGSELARAFHPYLTAAEAIKLAAQTFEKDVAMPSSCAS